MRNVRRAGWILLASAPWRKRPFPARPFSPHRKVCRGRNRRHSGGAGLGWLRPDDPPPRRPWRHRPCVRRVRPHPRPEVSRLRRHSKGLRGFLRAGLRLRLFPPGRGRCAGNRSPRFELASPRRPLLRGRRDAPHRRLYPKDRRLVYIDAAFNHAGGSDQLAAAARSAPAARAAIRRRRLAAPRCGAFWLEPGFPSLRKRKSAPATKSTPPGTSAPAGCRPCRSVRP